LNDKNTSKANPIYVNEKNKNLKIDLCVIDSENMAEGTVYFNLT